MRTYYSSDPQVPYTLVLRGVSVIRNIIGTLASPLIDREIFKGSELRVDILRLAATKSVPVDRFEPDLFQLASLSDFLLHQAEVRTQLTECIKEERNKWAEFEDVAMNANIWEHASVLSLGLYPKYYLTKGSPAVDEKLSPDEKYIFADNPETKSRFELEVSVPWDREHGSRCATFRDGVVLNFGSV